MTGIFTPQPLSDTAHPGFSSQSQWPNTPDHGRVMPKAANPVPTGRLARGWPVEGDVPEQRLAMLPKDLIKEKIFHSV